MNASIVQIDQALETLSETPMAKALRVTGHRVRLDSDSAGRDAVWIYVVVADEVRLDAATGADRVAYRHMIRKRVAEAGIDLPVYTRFRWEAEERRLRDGEGHQV